MTKKPLTLFVIYTCSTEPSKADPICEGLSMSTGAVGEDLNRSDVIDAVEESGQYRNDELLDDIVDAHRQKEIIATCYDRETYNRLFDVLTSMLIDDRFDDERQFKPVHASTLREAAFEVINRPVAQDIPWSDDPLPTDLDYRVNVLWWVDGEDGRTAGPAYIRRWEGPLPGRPDTTGGWIVPSANSMLTGPKIIDDEEWYSKRRWCAYISPPKALVQ